MQMPAKKDSHPTSSAIDTPLKEIIKTLPLRVLSEADWQHWITKGYVIVHQAVPPANVERLVNLLWQFDEKDPADPSTWYAPQRREHKMKELNNTGMLEIYNHQFLWDNRQEPRVYGAFVDIWDREDLWVTIDRANLNPPKKVKGNPNGFIHWDIDTSIDPLPIGVQGVLSLKKQDGDVGGFQCIPWLFEHHEEWVATQPADRDPMHPDTTGLDVVNIEMEPGDLLIFNSLLAHGVRPNHSDTRVRMAQYISMHPAEEHNEAERQERIRLWRELDHPRRDAFPGDPRDWEKHNATTAKLSDLGEKLLGLKSWQK
ncbi:MULTISPECIES: phytanoyl-CoA dioxygenase family protein [unclassified Rhizobium]|uniref:phytanoyl-CoA dioxygenase family protein n=1 Tax=unclassified Rhizobium TaxID=2613769 RepID=UPI000715C66C|nr:MULTISPECIES: phytanoyl-CoA dioxygenase family protein [unclassified Rhizobium]KQS96567.1 phytanoyl-CoA dioxygenase [Rhizobium sp. Leaf386]KQT06406.1 phytanoyl-CoA dioxygenase [Rhizobium sp. Leaf391]KQT92476.1 phytanoyl-CoA dioxygenase [Rhizobium sp. Leaf453]